MTRTCLTHLHIHVLVNFTLCCGCGKFERKCEKKKIEMKSKKVEKVKKNKYIFKINKLFLYVILNS